MAGTTREGDSFSDLARRIVTAWNNFWFSPGDPTVLGLIRLCCGLAVLYVHLAYTYDLQQFFGPQAWLHIDTINEFRMEAPVDPVLRDWNEFVPLEPKTPEEKEYVAKWSMHPDQASAKGHAIWSIWYHVTDPTWIWIVHSGFLVTMFLFAIGFCTRITAVMTWLAMLSYIWRAQTALFGMDTIMIVVVLYLMIGPSGAAFSVDRLIARYRATRKAQRPIPEPSLPEPQVSANLALRLLQIHVCIIYATSGMSKLLGPAWWNGTAVWGTMANPEFSPMSFKPYMDFLLYISKRRWLWELVMGGGTYFTLAFEISFAFLIWNRRLRWTMIVCSVLLHMGIAFFMGLVTFSMMMLIAVLSFVPPEAVRQVIGRFGQAAPDLRYAPARG